MLIANCTVWLFCDNSTIPLKTWRYSPWYSTLCSAAARNVLAFCPRSPDAAEALTLSRDSRTGPVTHVNSAPLHSMTPEVTPALPGEPLSLKMCSYGRSTPAPRPRSGHYGLFSTPWLCTILSAIPGPRLHLSPEPLRTTELWRHVSLSGSSLRCTLGQRPDPGPL